MSLIKDNVEVSLLVGLFIAWLNTEHVHAIKDAVAPFGPKYRRHLHRHFCAMCALSLWLHVVFRFAIVVSNSHC